MAAEPARDLARVVDLLWDKAEGGNVAAMKALYEHYRRDEKPEEKPQDDWAKLYAIDGSA
jgi:hypothetical protein